MAGSESHLVELAGIPGTDDVTPAVGVLLEIVDQLGDLIDTSAIGFGPAAPLRSIDWAEIAVGISPFIPDGDIVFVEIADIGIAFEEPEQLVDDRSEMELLRREQGKAVGQIKALLRTKDRMGSRTGAILLGSSMIEN